VQPCSQTQASVCINSVFQTCLCLMRSASAFHRGALKASAWDPEHQRSIADSGAQHATTAAASWAQHNVRSPANSHTVHRAQQSLNTRLQAPAQLLRFGHCQEAGPLLCSSHLQRASSSAVTYSKSYRDLAARSGACSPLAYWAPGWQAAALQCQFTQEAQCCQPAPGGRLVGLQHRH
jgi:hypothetical protein